ncbi:hypothetical protein CR513_44122, partial [Mucuna pruriens]
MRIPTLIYKEDLLYDLEDLLSPKTLFSTFRPMKLLHINLFSLAKTTSMSGKRFRLLVVNDYFR